MERINRRIVVAFAKVLSRRRRSAGLSQEALAERIDVSPRHLSYLETGRRQPSLSLLVALSTGLGISFRELAGEVEDTYRAAVTDDEDRQAPD